MKNSGSILCKERSLPTHTYTHTKRQDKYLNLVQRKFFISIFIFFAACLWLKRGERSEILIGRFVNEICVSAC